MAFPSRTSGERKADFAIHAISLAAFSVATAFLLTLANGQSGAWILAATSVYCLAGLFSISISFAYHLFPRHEMRPLLRRWDHAAIYPVIAGTFSPLLILAGTSTAFFILATMWAFAVSGIIFKLVATDMDPRWSLVSYLGLGAVGLAAMPDFWMQLPRWTSILIAGGAVFYVIGTIFYRRREMRYRYPVWHLWGTMGGSCLCAAIFVALAA